MNNLLDKIHNQYPYLTLHLDPVIGDSTTSSNGITTTTYRLSGQIYRKLIMSRYDQKDIGIHVFDVRDMTKYNKPSYSLFKSWFTVNYPLMSNEELKFSTKLNEVVGIITSLV